MPPVAEKTGSPEVAEHDEIPPVVAAAAASGRARVFRVFVSSTFDDFKVEREVLRRDVWPQLRALCASYGARFQAIDLRWGISEEAAADQQTMNICLGEIERCRRVTPRPNFLVLLGNHYGWRPRRRRSPSPSTARSPGVSPPMTGAWSRSGTSVTTTPSRNPSSGYEGALGGTWTRTSGDRRRRV
jgi:hypothetical protein